MLDSIDAVQPKKVVGDMLELAMTEKESVTVVRAHASPLRRVNRKLITWGCWREAQVFSMPSIRKHLSSLLHDTIPYPWQIREIVVASQSFCGV